MNTIEPTLFEDQPTVLEVAGGGFLELCRRQRRAELVINDLSVLGLGRYRVSVRYRPTPAVTSIDGQPTI
jgi:hypothetical protein